MTEWQSFWELCPKDLPRIHSSQERTGIHILWAHCGPLWDPQGCAAFWIKLPKSLNARVFEINIYDRCVTNKIIDETQCTIVWYVDDLTISHKKLSVVDQHIASLKEEYEKIGEMALKCGKVHDYLGMPLDFSKPSIFCCFVCVSMDLSIFHYWIATPSG